MIKIANTQFWVNDQDEALAFYTRTLGWEVRADVTMDEWNFRWLVVGPVGQNDVGLVLMPVPKPPMLDADSSAQLAELVAKGAGGTLFLETTTARPPTTSSPLVVSSSTTRPHVTGIGALWAEGVFWFETGAGTRKGRNLERDRAAR